MKGIDAPWYYKLEKAKYWYGALIAMFCYGLMNIGGHDMTILRGIASGEYDISALEDLYLGITNPNTVLMIGMIAVIGIFVGIAFAILIKYAHHRIAKDNFPFA